MDKIRERINRMIAETPTIRSIHYLGSKLRMLEAIKESVDDVAIEDGAICDLFSGSGTVSKYFLQYRDVISVDIQKYSQVICEASMRLLKEAPDVNDVLQDIENHTVSNALRHCFFELIEYERKCTEASKSGNIAPLYEIIEKGSLYIFEKGQSDYLTPELKACMKLGLSKINETVLLDSSDSMICRYYGGLYFSYEQSVILDCIAHWVFEQNGLVHTKALAALLSTASDIVNTVGKQFAQPLKVRDSKGSLKASLLNKIITDRSEDVYSSFAKWLSYYFSVGDDTHKCLTICDDYANALEKLEKYNISVVYADPPYTRYHYSRYYHVLETICLRDNPEVSTTFPNGKGGISRAIYRRERHQSPFCIKSQAESAFEVLFQKVKELNVPLVLSYSPFDASKAVTPRLQTIDQLVDKAKKYFTEVTVVSPGEFTHSKLNSAEKNFEANHEAELLIVCR